MNLKKSTAITLLILVTFAVDNEHTKIVSSMIGWGKGTDWDKTYDFFTKGNEWTYQELIKNYK